MENRVQKKGTNGDDKGHSEYDSDDDNNNNNGNNDDGDIRGRYVEY